MAIYPFLTFNGNCKEAMRFYQSCFGGELHFTYLGDTPGGKRFPHEIRQLVLHASLVSEHIRLYASDLGGEEGVASGNSISLWISITAPRQLKSVFQKLAKEGEVTAPLSPEVLKGQWATLTDRYAVQWIFSAASAS
ncbi:VOC family protein [Dyadobacter endophyticus]|uniref:VOC family protein n=1 Tax=Dyadobacter endophyticus TaxID=1749036 RepID=A0ABQ1YM68_9BACT|nr:VOC family protein [Dyadobacter endophyticus]GGH29246.1 VOC family protein [Dyadobacter endophyticus]